VTVNGEVSFWWAKRGRDAPRPPVGGVRALYTAYRAADRAERGRRTISPLATLADVVSGR